MQLRCATGSEKLSPSITERLESNRRPIPDVTDRTNAPKESRQHRPAPTCHTSISRLATCAGTGKHNSSSYCLSAPTEALSCSPETLYALSHSFQSHRTHRLIVIIVIKIVFKFILAVIIERLSCQKARYVLQKNCMGSSVVQ